MARYRRTVSGGVCNNQVLVSAQGGGRILGSNRVVVMVTKLFPFAMVAMSIGAAIVYACYGDVRHTVYWVAAAALTLSVTV